MTRVLWSRQFSSFIRYAAHWARWIDEVPLLRRFDQGFSGRPFSNARSGKSHRVHKRTSELFRDLAVAHTDGSIGRFLVRLSCIDILLFGRLCHGSLERCRAAGLPGDLRRSLPTPLHDPDLADAIRPPPLEDVDDLQA